MSRRVRLPGADELFRSTAPAVPGSPLPPDPGQSPEASSAAGPAPAPAHRVPAAGRSAASPSGRERHDAKITVYCSDDELIALEHARLVLRRDHGVAVDRGRIVREAVAMTLEELEARGPDSPLVRRLRRG